MCVMVVWGNYMGGLFANLLTCCFKFAEMITPNRKRKRYFCTKQKMPKEEINLKSSIFPPINGKRKRRESQEKRHRDRLQQYTRISAIPGIRLSYPFFCQHHKHNTPGMCEYIIFYMYIFFCIQYAQLKHSYSSSQTPLHTNTFVLLSYIMFLSSSMLHVSFIL
jgi:hypothetical protein